MSRTARTAKITLAALTLVAVTAGSSLACGGGGGGGRTSGRFAINYHRNVGHMKTQAPRQSYNQGGNYHRAAPSYHQAPVVSQPIHHQPVAVQPQHVQQPVQQPIVQQPTAAPQFAPQQGAQPTGVVTTPATVDPTAQSPEDAALAALAAFGE
ncbi:hypothetical protein [Botrimarina mediterranea]|uniref:Lipoprotein n=1 Tax=Botrimarina mediterranea TaxID=2528022 RepID=A0A518KAE4_9BACT|nr:hypothetical protein [Botrimarina mediterranea]QDV74756.1 hypothetical protein Spa11_29640 [Botrimarina mediterranea]QDV79401.1 hypothetical protein K2D_30150 [Planctomycetes bacterium K2D]